MFDMKEYYVLQGCNSLPIYFERQRRTINMNRAYDTQKHYSKLTNGCM